MKKHIRFIIGGIFIFLLNLRNKLTSKWVYIWITPRQWWLMVYKEMDRIEAIKHLENRGKLT